MRFEEGRASCTARERNRGRTRERGGAPVFRPSTLTLFISLSIAGPTMAMIAFKCPDIQVTVVDINQVRE